MNTDGTAVPWMETTAAGGEYSGSGIREVLQLTTSKDSAVWSEAVRKGATSPPSHSSCSKSSKYWPSIQTFVFSHCRRLVSRFRFLKSRYDVRHLPRCKKIKFVKHSMRLVFSSIIFSSSPPPHRRPHISTGLTGFVEIPTQTWKCRDKQFFGMMGNVTFTCQSCDERSPSKSTYFAHTEMCHYIQKENETWCKHWTLTSLLPFVEFWCLCFVQSFNCKVLWVHRIITI